MPPQGHQNGNRSGQPSAASVGRVTSVEMFRAYGSVNRRNLVQRQPSSLSSGPRSQLSVGLDPLVHANFLKNEGCSGRRSQSSRRRCRIAPVLPWWPALPMALADKPTTRVILKAATARCASRKSFYAPRTPATPVDARGGLRIRVQRQLTIIAGLYAVGPASSEQYQKTRLWVARVGCRPSLYDRK